jgi:hypothetical protein
MKKIFASLAILSVTPMAFAANLTFYSQPSTNSQIIGKVTPQNQAQFIEIIQGKNNWLKVANKETGNVGWINKTQIQASSSNDKVKALNQALYQVNQEQQQAILAQKQFNVAFANTMQQLKQKRMNLQTELQQASVQTDTKIKHPSHTKAMQNPIVFKQRTVSYNGGSDALITTVWMNKNGQKHMKEYEVPVSKKAAKAS